MIPIISLNNKTGEILKPWSPIEIAEANDQVVRMALFDGEHPWHKHVNEDELFYVYKGRIAIRVKGHPDVALNEGEMAVIPKGLEHSPKSLEPSYVLMFEPKALKSRGDSTGDTSLF